MSKKNEKENRNVRHNMNSFLNITSHVKMWKWNGVTRNGIRTLFPSHRSHLISRTMPKHTHSICTHHFLHMYIYPKHMYVYVHTYENLKNYFLLLYFLLYFFSQFSFCFILFHVFSMFFFCFSSVFSLDFL